MPKREQDGPRREQPLLVAAADRTSEKLAAVRGALARLNLRADRRTNLERLLLLIDNATDAGSYCFAFVATLADRLSLSRRTVQQLLADGRAAGVVETVESFERKGGGQSSSGNRIVWPRVRELARPPVTCAAPRTSCAPPRTKCAAQRKFGAEPQAAVEVGAPSYIWTLKGSSNPPPPTSIEAPEEGGGGKEFGVRNSECGVPDAPKWVDVEARLRRLGINAADLVWRPAAERGVTPAEALAVCDWYEVHAGCFDKVGALAWRLARAWPGQPAQDGWPPASRAHAAEAANEAAREETRRIVASGRVGTPMTREEFAELRRELRRKEGG